MDEDDYITAEIIETDISDLCRICGSSSESPLIPIYEENGLTEDLASKIMLYLPIKVAEEDILPVKVCVMCTNSILTWHLLYECCVDADRRFKSMLSMSVVEQLVVDPQHVDGTEDEPVQELERQKGDKHVEAKMYVAMAEDAVDPVKETADREMDDIMFLKAEFGPEDEQYLDDESNPNNDENGSENDDPKPMNSSRCDHDDLICLTCSTEMKNNKHEVSVHIIAHANSDCDIRCKVCYYCITYKCNICDSNFGSRSDMIKHRSTHDEICCNICNKLFKTYGTMMTHKRNHEANIIYYSCSICDWQTNRKYNLQLHTKSHSQDHFCKLCCCSFNSKHILENHKANHLKEDLANYDNADCKVICNVCEKDFNSKYKLYVHNMESHNSEKERFRCRKCGRLFETDTMLRCHEKSHNKKIFECKICNKTFIQLKNLAEHKNTHLDKRPFECEICSKRFKYSSNLSQHRGVHKDVKNFTCQYCDKKFTRSNTLNMHLRSHRNERNYVCVICKTSFIQPGSLVKHTRSMHRKCDLCGQIIGDRKQWQVHVYKECAGSEIEDYKECIS